METLQVESELADMLAMYQERKPIRVLEIGVWQGGTLRYWLRHATPGAKIVAVDLAHPNADAYENWKRAGTDLWPVTGASQDPDVIAWCVQLGPYDWVFIDGDHGYSGVLADVSNYLPLVAPGGVLLMHDIIGPDCWTEARYPPGDAFDLFRQGRVSIEIVSMEPSDVSHGIGGIFV